MENSLKYLERSINEFKEVEELLELFQDTTLNEGNITGLPSRKGWDLVWEEKLKKYMTNDASVLENNTLMQMYILCQRTLPVYSNIYHT